MKEITGSIDKTVNHSKPTKRSTGSISNRLVQESGTVEDLAVHLVQPYGYTFAPSIYKNNIRNNENWLEQWIIALDIDKGLSFDEYMSIAQKYDIKPTFVYTTFSSTHNDRFRPVYVLSAPIKDIRIRRTIIAFLTSIFSKIDKNTLDEARLFYGGKELIYTDYDHTLNIMNVIDATVRYIYDTDSPNAARKVKDLCAYTGLALKNGAPYIIQGSIEKIADFDESAATTIRYIMVDDSDSSNIDIHTKTISFIYNQAADYHVHTKKYPVVNHKTEKRELIRNADWDLLEREDALYRSFINGTRWLYYPELLGIAMNLVLLNGGEKRFFEGLAKLPDKYDMQKWQYTVKKIKQHGYNPTNYDTYYPDDLQKPAARNMVALATHEKRKIDDMIATREYSTLDSAEVNTYNAFNAALAAHEHGVYAINSYVGIGKTRLYETVENATIAVPLHALKDEVYQRMINAGNTAIVSPELPDSIPAHIRSTVDNLYKIGAIKAANVYLRNEAKNNIDIAEYIKQKDRTAKVRNQNVITTHQRLFYLEDTNDTIIIDEDIISSMFPIGNASLKDVLYMESITKPTGFSRVKRESPVHSIVSFIDNALPYLVYKMPDYKLTPAEHKIVEQAVIDKKLSSNVIGLLAATHFYKVENTVHYIQRKTLPKDKKIIILSATANETIYRLAFGNELKSFVDIGDVELKGEMTQIYNINTSRNAFDNNPENIELVQSIISKMLSKDANVITYKSFEDKLNAANHFGALLGLDKYKGQDLAVVGTPHFNEVVYLLLAVALGISITHEWDDTLAYARVIRRGYRFDFMTYTRNELLKEVQMYLIESELVQAIGRARALRYDVRVLIFSNLPINGAKLLHVVPELQDNEMTNDCAMLSV